MTEQNDLCAALVEAQKEMKNAPLNKVNPHFKSKYADLASIRDAVIPVLSKHGIALVQEIQVRDYGPVVVTKLLKGTDAIVSECPVMVAEKCKPQEFGSALTYARRYGMAAICGIAADEDDDANAAQGADETQRPTKVAAPKGTSPDLINNDGTLKVTELKDRLKILGRDVMACSDADELTALLNHEPSQEIMGLAEKFLPDWWFGTEGEDNGLKNLIAKQRESFTQEATE